MVLVFWSGNPLDAQRYLGGSVRPNDPDIFPDLGISDWGVLGSFLMGVITLSFVSRRQLKKSPTELLQSGEFISVISKATDKDDSFFNQYLGRSTSMDLCTCPS